MEGKFWAHFWRTIHHYKLWLRCSYWWVWSVSHHCYLSNKLHIKISCPPCVLYWGYRVLTYSKLSVAIQHYWHTGLPRLLKWGHLKELHKAIKLCETALLNNELVTLGLGLLQEVIIYLKTSINYLFYYVTFTLIHMVNTTLSIISSCYNIQYSTRIWSIIIFLYFVFYTNISSCRLMFMDMVQKLVLPSLLTWTIKMTKSYIFMGSHSMYQHGQLAFCQIAKMLYLTRQRYQ